MEPNATLDQASPAIDPKLGVASIGKPHAEDAVQPGSATRSAQGNISALAAANAGAHSPAVSSLRFPGEDGGLSLVEMAQRDLDAALQLLADRAQYITGAAGAAIALRRSGKTDMLCRASAGEIAPELGALLSSEFGLSGECVRTRQLLRCDDAERDRRVNHEACRQMGIASVVVMPVVQDDTVLGVFELFSAKANAFSERDSSALKRLSEMVATAVRLAHVAEELPERLLAVEPSPEAGDTEIPPAQEPLPEIKGALSSELPPAIADQVGSAPSQAPAQADSSPLPTPAPPQRPLFWSIPLNAASADTPQPNQPDQSRVPPVLRNLHQCQACGFPVSAGRALCVECEEKKWRGQLKVPPSAAPPQASVKPSISAASARALAGTTPPAKPAAPHASMERAVSGAAGGATLQPPTSAPAQQNDSARVPQKAVSQRAPEPLLDPLPDFVLSAGLEPPQSWFSRNKYILGAILVVAAVVAAIFLLR